VACEVRHSQLKHFFYALGHKTSKSSQELSLAEHTFLEGLHTSGAFKTFMGQIVSLSL